MYSRYVTTALEDWVTNLYTRMGIVCPEDIDEAYISMIFDIYLRYQSIPSCSTLLGDFKVIVIDSRLPIQEQRVQFFHELCHILRHVGNQSMMPDAFRQLLEWDAIHFTRYAAIPYHMMMKYDYRDPDIIKILAEDFRVPEQLCWERVEKRYRLYQLIG